MAKFCQVDGSRTRLVWLVGGRVWRAWMRHCRPSIGRALLHTGDHIRGCTGPTIREL